MEGERRRSEVQSLLEVIKSSNDIESRVSLIARLGDSFQLEESDLALVVECLPTFWDESVCSGISQCTLNKGVLHLAVKYLELKSSCCVSHFIILATKASLWCRKHLEITIMSAVDSQQEEHSILFIQLIVDSLSFSSAVISSLTSSPFLGEKIVLLIVENFILEVMNLMKAIVSEIKKIHSVAAAVLKMMPVVLDAVIKLSRAYTEAVKHDHVDVSKDNSQIPMGSKGVDYSDHAVNISKIVIQNLYELGIFAASGGGNLVSVLNASWKGVVSLLQLGKGVLVDKINVGDIILTIVSLATDSLRCTAETWFNVFKGGNLTLSEAKRALLPVKFYLINAVRVTSEYPCQAIKVSEGIIKCVLMISSFPVYFCKEDHLKAASEALAEVLEPTAFLLLCTILNSAVVKLECRLQMLDVLFPDESNEGNSSIVSLDEEINRTTNLSTSGYQLACEDMSGTETLILGRVILFLNLLKGSALLGEEMVLEISRKLGYLVGHLSNENVYSSFLVLYIPQSPTSGSTMGVGWQPMLPFLLHCLKAFMVVAVSSDLAWVEVESFLLQNFFHPHVICVEIVIELWCFLIRHAEQEKMHDALDSLYSLFKIIALSEQALEPSSPLRKMARSISTIVACAPQSSVDYFYNSMLADDKSYLSSFMHVAILMEGFPLSSLSDSLKNLSIQRTLDAFLIFMDDNNGKLGPLDTSGSSSSAIIGLPVHALSYVLRCSEINSPVVFDNKRISWLLKFTASVIHEYRTASDSKKYHYSALLGAMLHTISNTEQSYTSDEMGPLVLELHTLFVAGSTASDTVLYQCKSALASFMAGICHMQLEEGDSTNIASAVWDLYHILLREKHWAFIHLALTVFGYFSHRTSCSELWRFVPHDAALSFDTETGKEASEESFMSEFKAFLQKEMPLAVITPCKEELNLLVKEGALLRENVAMLSDVSSKVSESEIMEIDDDKQTINKKRKLPDGVSKGLSLLFLKKKGLSLLRSGLKVLSDAFTSPDTGELKEEFSTHISCLEDVISHLSSLSDGV